MLISNMQYYNWNNIQNSTMPAVSLPDDHEDLHVNLIINDGMSNESAIEGKKVSNICVFAVLIKCYQPTYSILNQ